jgi:biopolymer transport protein ExbD
MAFSVGGSSDESMVDINTTPLIDVMLVLLIVLILSVPPITHAVKLDMPRPNVAPPLIPPTVVDLEVDFDGTVLWNGMPVDSATLNSYFYTTAAQDPQPEIHLRPNRRVKYDYVAKVLAAAQRLGVKRIGFVGNEQFMEQS